MVTFSYFECNMQSIGDALGNKLVLGFADYERSEVQCRVKRVHLEILIIIPSTCHVAPEPEGDSAFVSVSQQNQTFPFSKNLEIATNDLLRTINRDWEVGFIFVIFILVALGLLIAFCAWIGGNKKSCK